MSLPPLRPPRKLPQSSQKLPFSYQFWDIEDPRYVLPKVLALLPENRNGFGFGSPSIEAVNGASPLLHCKMMGDKVMGVSPRLNFYPHLPIPVGEGAASNGKLGDSGLSYPAAGKGPRGKGVVKIFVIHNGRPLHHDDPPFTGIFIGPYEWMKRLFTYGGWHHRICTNWIEAITVLLAIFHGSVPHAGVIALVRVALGLTDAEEHAINALWSLVAKSHEPVKMGSSKMVRDHRVAPILARVEKKSPPLSAKEVKDLPSRQLGVTSAEGARGGGGNPAPRVLEPTGAVPVDASQPTTGLPNTGRHAHLGMPAPSPPDGGTSGGLQVPELAPTSVFASPGAALGRSAVPALPVVLEAAPSLLSSTGTAPGRPGGGPPHPSTGLGRVVPPDTFKASGAGELPSRRLGATSAEKASGGSGNLASRALEPPGVVLVGAGQSSTGLPNAGHQAHLGVPAPSPPDGGTSFGFQVSELAPTSVSASPGAAMGRSAVPARPVARKAASPLRSPTEAALGEPGGGSPCPSAGLGHVVPPDATTLPPGDTTPTVIMAHQHLQGPPTWTAGDQAIICSRRVGSLSKCDLLYHLDGEKVFILSCDHPASSCNVRLGEEEASMPVHTRYLVPMHDGVSIPGVPCLGAAGVDDPWLDRSRQPTDGAAVAGTDDESGTSLSDDSACLPRGTTARVDEASAPDAAHESCVDPHILADNASTPPYSPAGSSSDPDEESGGVETTGLSSDLSIDEMIQVLLSEGAISPSRFVVRHKVASQYARHIASKAKLDVDHAPIVMPREIARRDSSSSKDVDLFDAAKDAAVAEAMEAAVAVESALVASGHGGQASVLESMRGDTEAAISHARLRSLDLCADARGATDPPVLGRGRGRGSPARLVQRFDAVNTYRAGPLTAPRAPSPESKGAEEIDLKEKLATTFAVGVCLDVDHRPRSELSSSRRVTRSTLSIPPSTAGGPPPMSADEVKRLTPREVRAALVSGGLDISGSVIQRADRLAASLAAASRT